LTFEGGFAMLTQTHWDLTQALCLILVDTHLLLIIY